MSDGPQREGDFIYPFTGDDMPIDVTITVSDGFWDMLRAAAVAFGTATEEEMLATSDQDIALAMCGGTVDTSATTPSQVRRRAMEPPTP